MTNRGGRLTTLIAIAMRKWTLSSTMSPTTLVSYCNGMGSTNMLIKNTVEYKLISRHYGDQVAKRSQVPLMNHINEGLVVLDAIGATVDTKCAFCIHPLLQADEDLQDNFNRVAFTCDPAVTMLAMEYRSVANEFLSDKMDNIVIEDISWGIAEAAKAIRLSPLKEVNDMLIADKVQNYKDFVTYHQKTHARSSQLDDYFNMWLDRLGVFDKQYGELIDLIDRSKV